MNLRIIGKTFMLYASTALIAFGLSGYLNKALGLEASLLNEPWKMIAIAGGLSVLTGYLHPLLRGVKRGDQLITFVKRFSQQGTFVETVFVTALEDGKKGAKIRVQLTNGALAEGIITDYAGTLTPPVIRLTDAENAVQMQARQ